MEPQSSHKQGMAVASLVLGIIALVLFLFWYISIILATLAIIFGALSIKSPSRGKALTGIITGSVSIVFSVLAIAAVFIALPLLQQGQRDTSRKNDVSTIASSILTYASDNNGVLPTAADLSTDDLVTIAIISEFGEPGPEHAIYKAGVSCDGTASARSYSISVRLEDGEIYCQDS